MPKYHPSDDLLLQFAAGHLNDALGLLIACHIEYCPRCVSRLKLFEAFGGDSLANFDNGGIEMSNGALEQLMLAIDGDQEFSSTPDEHHPASVQRGQQKSPAKPDAYGMPRDIPRPLRRYITSNFEALPWKGLTPSIRWFDLKLPCRQYRSSLYHIAAGKKLPEHSHEGNEYTIVLCGAFYDNAARYEVGDFVWADNTIVHQPTTAENQECTCFVVMDAPLRMT